MKTHIKDPKAFMYLCVGIAVVAVAATYAVVQVNNALQIRALRRAAERQMQNFFPMPTQHVPAPAPLPPPEPSPEKPVRARASMPGARTAPPTMEQPAAVPATPTRTIMEDLRIVAWTFGAPVVVPEGTAAFGLEVGSSLVPVTVDVENRSGQLAGSINIRVDGYWNGAKVLTDTIHGANVPPRARKDIEGTVRMPKGIRTDKTTATIIDADAGPSGSYF